ncbi:hypothetical protein ACLBV5_12375 [Brevundimonas sp. M1A4_2e]|jgi:hypothetical protein|nr:hypothetical protein [Brevundimonas naejangsanensis]
MSVLQKRAASALAGLALVATLGATGAASAQPSRPSSGCLLRIEPQLARWEIRGYDPYGGDAAFATFDIAWTNEGEAACDGEVEVNTQGLPFGLRPATGPSGRWTTLPYSLTDEYSAANLTPVAGRSQARPGGVSLALQPGARVMRRYRFEVDVDQLSQDGLFEQTVQFAFRSTDNRITVDKLVVLALNVQPSAVMGLRGAFIRTDGGGRIELGELTEGGTNLPLQVWVKSTGGYRVVVSSRNKGRLVLAEDSSWWVPYRLSLNSRPINLGIGGHVESRKGTGMNEDAYDLQLQVGETARRRAGLYSDLIELTVAPI